MCPHNHRPVSIGAGRSPALHGKSLRIALALLAVQLAVITGYSASVTLRVVRTNNTAVVVVSPIVSTGAVFIVAAADLASLGTAPSMFFQTNTPITNELRLAVPTTNQFSQRGFFKAAHWEGQAPPLVPVSPGTFVMGASSTEAQSTSFEGPQTTVTLTYPFMIGKYEVTQGEYQALMTNNPSYFSGVTKRPVEQVTWTNATSYCARLTQLQQAAGCLPPGWAYRLPTEAEWEYACRAGTTTALHYGTALHSGMANFDGHYEYDSVLGTVFNSAGTLLDRPTNVGSYLPNAWGIYDMHGNVWEWCQDRWADNLPGGTVTNPQGPNTGSSRVVRGGGWYNQGSSCRSAYRTLGTATYKGNEIGFRIVLSPAIP